MSLARRIQSSWSSKGLLSTALLPLAWLYELLAATLRGIHTLKVKLGLTEGQVLPVPVLVVGNLIVGGAGKTPTVLALLKMLGAAGWRVGVISRGYGREGDEVRVLHADSAASEVGDEPLLIHRRGAVPVAVGRDRVAAARALLAAEPGLQLIISDDGLQHLRLPRALSVWVFDERGAGNSRLLPAGPLRTGLPTQVPSDTLVLYNAAQPSTPLPGFLGQRQLSGAVALADWWQGAPATLPALHALRGIELLATAGMAQPQRFFDMLREQGLNITPLPLPDHFDFAALPWPANIRDVVLTEKDAVKIRLERVPAGTRVWVIALDFLPEPAFASALERALRPLLTTPATE